MMTDQENASDGPGLEDPDSGNSDQSDDSSKMVRWISGLRSPKPKYLALLLFVVGSCWLASYFGLQCSTTSRGHLICGLGVRDQLKIEEQERGWVEANRKEFEKEQRKWMDWMVKEGIAMDVDWGRMAKAEELEEYGEHMADYGCDVAELGTKIKEHGVRLMKIGSRYHLDAVVLKRNGWRWENHMTSSSGSTKWVCRYGGQCTETSGSSWWWFW